MKTKTAKPQVLGGSKYTVGKFKADLLGWCLCLPSILILIVYSIYPLVGSIVMAFAKTKGFTIVGWIGFQNFRDVLQHPHFLKALSNSVTYVFWSLVIGLLMPVVIAALTGEVTHGRGFYRIAMRLPGILPAIASLMILSFFFRADNTGVLNQMFQAWGLTTRPLKFLSNQDMVIFWLIICATWKGAGGTALLYMAAMSDISPELYEAAALDGASPLRRFVAITWPAIQGQFSLLLILQIIGVFQILYEPMVMTFGGPNNSSLSMMYLVYRYAFEDGEVGRANALGAIMSVFLVGLSIIRYAIQKRNADN